MAQFFRKNYVCLPDISRCCFIYSFKQVVRNSLATFSHQKIGMLIFVSLCFNQCHFYSNHTFQYLCKQGCSILVELHKKSNWFNIRSMFSCKPLYPIGGTMSCSLRRYMVFYYLATLFVLSLDSNTSGLHVNLLAGWTYIGGAGQDSMIGCSISVVLISPLPSLRTWISLVG